jgi:hypothetical protein
MCKFLVFSGQYLVDSRNFITFDDCNDFQYNTNNSEIIRGQMCSIFIEFAANSRNLSDASSTFTGLKT